MRNFTRFFFVIWAILPLSVMGADVTYTFDSGGNGYYDGSTWTGMSLYGAGTFETTDAATLSVTLGDGNSTKFFHSKTLTGNTCSADLTNIPSSSDYSVEWVQYIKTATTAAKNGLVLRAQSTASGYSASVRQGYYFAAQSASTAANGSVRFRIGILGSSGFTSKLDQTVTGLTFGGSNTGPLYLKAVVQGTSLSLFYKTTNDGAWIQAGTTLTDATYSSGLTQIAWGLGTSSHDEYFDNVAYTNLTIPGVQFTDNNKYVYTGSAQGPGIATVSGFASTPTLSYTYKGIGATTFGPSTSLPSNVGQYAAFVNAASGGQSANDTLAFEILPTAYNKYYTFNDDTYGSVAANSKVSTTNNHLVQKGLGYMLGTNGLSGYKSYGKMLQSTGGNAMTTLLNFGATDSISTDYQVVWKDYTSAIAQKRGVILRAKGTNTFLTVSNSKVNVGQGYMFYVNNLASSTMQLDIRKLHSDTTTYKSPSVLATTTTATYTGVNAATWFRATAKGDSLIFEYSLDGTTWVTAHKIVDNGTKGDIYTSGTTQVTSINLSGNSYYFDYFGYKTIESVSTSVNSVITDNSGLVVTINGQSVVVKNAANFDVYNTQGLKIKSVRSSEFENTIILQPGVYIIKSNNSVKKVIVR